LLSLLQRPRNSVISQVAPCASASISILTLHDALPILAVESRERVVVRAPAQGAHAHGGADQCTGLEGVQLFQRGDVQRTAIAALDRKSTRLNSSHVKISYAVFCLKK